MNKRILNDRLNFVGENDYGGHGTKTAVLYNGKRYLMKIPEPVREISDLDLSLHSVSEYISCHIAQSMGLNCQNTILGEWTDNDGHKYDCCLCEDFTYGTDYKLAEVKAMCYKYGDMTQAERTALEEMPTFERIENFYKRAENIDEKEALREFGRIFVLDSFVGNTDRHTGNYGFLQNLATGEIKPSPIYDCGSSLFPTKSDQEILTKPLGYLSGSADSVIRQPSNEKLRINYKAFLFEDNLPWYVRDAVLELVPRINLGQIRNCVDSAVPYISQQRAEILYNVLESRYNDTLMPAFKNILTKDLDLNVAQSVNTRRMQDEILNPIKKYPIKTDIPVKLNNFFVSIFRINENVAIVKNAEGTPISYLDLRPSNKYVIKTAASLMSNGLLPDSFLSDHPAHTITGVGGLMR